MEKHRGDIAPRRALPGDARALLALTRRAYGKWVALIDAEPQPMGGDYDAIIARDQVWLVDGPEALAGCLILRALPDHLLV